MYFAEGRIKRFISDIQALVCTGRDEVKELKVRYGEIPKNVKISSIDDDWQDYKAGTVWSGSYSGEYALFRARVEHLRYNGTINRKLCQAALIEGG